MSLPLHVHTIKPTPEERDRWQRLVFVALERGLRSLTLGGDRYLVSSNSEDGVAYEVAVRRVASDTTEASCSCKANEFEEPCTHIALVLDQHNLWPEKPAYTPLVDPAIARAILMGGR